MVPSAAGIRLPHEGVQLGRVVRRMPSASTASSGNSEGLGSEDSGDETELLGFNPTRDLTRFALQFYEPSINSAAVGTLLPITPFSTVSRLVPPVGAFNAFVIEFHDVTWANYIHELRFAQDRVCCCPM